MAGHTQSDSKALVSILVNGLRKLSTDGHESAVAYTETFHLPRDTEIPVLWEKIRSLGYKSPLIAPKGAKELWGERLSKRRFKPYERVAVVADESLADSSHIYINEPLIAFANREEDKELKLEIGSRVPNNSYADDNSCSDTIDIGDGLSIHFHRTLRMPDDDKLHQLPPSLGFFPLYNVSAYADRLPRHIAENGGVFLPIWSREALWMEFNSRNGRTFALRVYVGRINAVTGNSMDEDTSAEGNSERQQDYVVVPGQKWLDGICVQEGVVRQFVSMPLGSGYTVEGQKTGEEKHGGLQIEIIPAYRRGLKSWLSDNVGEPAPNDIFTLVQTLDETSTPVELGFKAGDVLRQYHSGTTWTIGPRQLFDMDDSVQSGEIQVEAVYRNSDGVLFYGRKPGDGYPDISSLTAWDPLGHEDFSAYSLPDEIRILSRSKKGVDRNSSLYMGSPSLFKPFMPRSGVDPDTNLVEKIDDGDREAIFSAEIIRPSEARPVARIKDLKSMGLAAGGKLIQDIYKDQFPAQQWNPAAARIVNIHLLDPVSCEKVTHIVPPPPPRDAKTYAEAGLPFFVVEEQVDNRLEGGDFEGVKSVSAMDKMKGVVMEAPIDPSKPTMCLRCKVRLCDCIIRPCNHLFCNVCIKKLEDSHGSSVSEASRSQTWRCPTCNKGISHVAGFSAPMNLPGEEALKVKVPVHVFKVEDGRVRFQSIQKMRV